jgi:NB-ARC domain
MGKFPFLHTAMEAVANGALCLLESEDIRYHRALNQLQRLNFAAESIKCGLIHADEDRSLYIDACTTNLWPLLRSLSFDADNILDEHLTALRVYWHRLQRSSNASASAWSRKRKWYQIDFPSISPELGPRQRRRLSSEVDQINKRLEELSRALEALKALRLRGKDGIKMTRPRWRDITHRIFPHHNQAVFVGRQHEKDEIVKLLTSDLRPLGDSRLTLPVIPIHGPAAIGKTTLAQMIYNDERIDEYFGFKVWVCLTNGCHLKSAMKEIYEKITGKSCAFQALDALQNSLRYACSSDYIHLFMCNYMTQPI